MDFYFSKAATDCKLWAIERQVSFLMLINMKILFQTKKEQN